MNLRFKEYGDIHLFHNRTPTSHIVSSFKMSLPDTDDLNNVDIIFLNGDVWDRDSSFWSDDTQIAMQWMFWLLSLCKKRNIKLRVLEGTPSHDWKQSSYFKTINEMFELGCDLRYIETLSIEYFPEYDINVLYVPDEWRTESSVTQREIQELLIKHGLKQVHFTMIHGAFEHQMPPAARNSKEVHSLDFFRSITIHRIFGAHIHQRSDAPMFSAAGSFDRLSHSDEGPKGHIDYTLKDGVERIKFVVNKNAMLYKTINCVDLDTEAAIEKIDAFVKDLPPGSHFRILANRTDPIFSSHGMLQIRHRQYHWSFKDAMDKDELQLPANKIAPERRVLKKPCLNKTNLKPALMARMVEKYPEHISLCEDIYEQVISDVKQ